MSVAFTREEDAEAAAAFLPERPVSPHPNHVTQAGLDAIEAALALARQDHAAAQAAGDAGADRTAIARAARDLRYYGARRATALLVRPDPASPKVQFGGTVTIVRADGRRQTFRIVGEDEADAAQGSVSHVSPLARAVLGREVGDEATLGGSPLEIAAVDNGA